MCDYATFKPITKKCPHCGKDMISHVIEEGSHFHVTMWDANGSHCSERDCEHNHGEGKCVPKKISDGKMFQEDYMR